MAQVKGRTMDGAPRPTRAWTMLALGTLAQTAGTIFVSAPAFLIPVLHSERSLSLSQAGLLASAPLLGLVLALIVWGAAADRFGERRVIALGLALTAGATVGAMLATDDVALGVFFVLGGAGAASTNAASGRVVVGWFPQQKRGLAMGIRQMAQPLGTTVAALVVPSASESGIAGALVVPLVLVALMAVTCAIGIVNPPRRETSALAAGANPYRASAFLWRIHAVSMLLVVPQYTLTLFGLVWLVSDRGWSPIGAGAVIGVAQFLGAIGRIGVGVLSDRVGSRVRPLRWISVAAGIMMLTLAAAATTNGSWASIILVVATIVSVADNGLAFTSVAEIAGPRWAGRALGAQNTGQFLAAAAVGPVVGVLITTLGYPLAFAISALGPAIAIPLIPHRRTEHDRL